MRISGATIPRARGCALPVFGPRAAYHPTIHPAQFGPDVDNPWFPLKPGTTFVYAATADDGKVIDVFAVSSKTRVIDGVRTRVVKRPAVPQRGSA